ncbi:hypothetical protein BBK82_43565 [Lentzea guizhouensis]|uniref:Uncharacterized protein n=1 Tax=Lentzea guizhouensis TaxID=1586287 RepID=A0A1B2HVP7_9PSEU|nr:hypothetical protein [Lentzea guizhouensis]ANZ41801.1 hypothetical protein BBK82_43565 [Lentzea guizhouensis]
MGYELHITRAEPPIGFEEWLDFARRRSDLREEGEVSYLDLESQPVYLHTCRDGVEVSLHWYGDRVRVKGVRSERGAGSLVRMADALRGRLVGDEGEVYGRRGLLRWFRRVVNP